LHTSAFAAELIGYLYTPAMLMEQVLVLFVSWHVSVFIFCAELTRKLMSPDRNMYHGEP